jgi:hypothetical protein
MGNSCWSAHKRCGGFTDSVEGVRGVVAATGDRVTEAHSRTAMPERQGSTPQLLAGATAATTIDGIDYSLAH